MTDNARPWLAAAGIYLTVFVIWGMSTAYFAAASGLVGSFDLSGASLGWALNSYALAGAALLLIAGRLGDIFSTSMIYNLGAALMVCAVLIMAISMSSAIFISGRVIAGAGAALLLTCCLAMLSLLPFSASARTWAFGLFAAASWAGSFLGPLIGTMLVASWRAIPLVSAALICSGWLCLRLSRIHAEQRRHSQHKGSVDWLGAVLWTVTICLLVAPLIQAPTIGWQPWSTWSIALTIVSALMFFGQQRRTSQPILDAQVVRNRGAMSGSLLTLLMSFTIAAILLFISPYLTNVRELDPNIAALMTVPMAIAIIVMLPAGSWASAHLGPLRTSLAGFSAVVIGLAILTFSGPSTAVAILLIALVLYGGGMGIAFPAAQRSAMASLPPEQAGIASGMFNTGSMLGTVLGPVCAAFVFTLVASRQLNTAQLTTYLNAGSTPDPPLVSAFSAGNSAVMALLAITAFAGILIAKFGFTSTDFVPTHFTPTKRRIAWTSQTSPATD